MKNEILASFYNSLVRLNRPGEKTIIAAVSGGADSVALFHMLNLAADELRVKIVAAHFNHKLRGAESLRDELFVKNLAALYKTPYECSRADVKKAASPGKGGLEKTARDLRYSFLVKTAKKYGSGTIALGHNLDDNAETLIFRLITGAGAAGLSSIPEQREISGGIRLIRPLLGIKKTEIINYLKNEKIPFVFDSSNAGNDYTRNRIRHGLIPLIEKEYNEGFKDAAARTVSIITNENDFMEHHARAAYGRCVRTAGGGAVINTGWFLRLHTAIRYRVSAMILKNLISNGRKVTFGQVSLLNHSISGGKAASLPDGFIAAPHGNHFLVSKNEAKKEARAVVFDPQKPGVFTYDGISFSHSVIKNVKKHELRDKNRAYLDLNRIRGKITVRHKKKGDRFRPFGMASAIKLKKFFIDNKLEKNTPVFIKGKKAMWVAGVRAGEEVKVKKGTSSILKIEIINPA
jgi:tRNA(Ile)-lysidine synthase